MLGLECIVMILLKALQWGRDLSPDAEKVAFFESCERFNLSSTRIQNCQSCVGF
ncbi:hypothetical protein M758_6G097600 [Ceratodon purpureus]|nr:hypothetical protein M758_6G097600 [Ceratodon purpureus]